MSATLAAPGKTRIGWIGTGVMGSAMCGHLLDKGYSATVYNRTRSKTASLIDRGAQWADSPAGVAAQSDIVFTIVGFPCDLRSVTLGPQGTLSTAQPGTILVDMTTVLTLMETVPRMVVIAAPLSLALSGSNTGPMR